MATLTICNLDPAVKEQLRIRAARHGRSMQEEVRRILQARALTEPVVSQEFDNLYERIRARFTPIGGAYDLALVPRAFAPEPPPFRSLTQYLFGRLPSRSMV